jgi:cytochrome c556
VLKAVQSKDKAKVEEVAGEIDATCDVCHDKYPAAEVPASAEGAKPAEAPK